MAGATQAMGPLGLDSLALGVSPTDPTGGFQEVTQQEVCEMTRMSKRHEEYTWMHTCTMHNNMYMCMYMHMYM